MKLVIWLWYFFSEKRKASAHKLYWNSEISCWLWQAYGHNAGGKVKGFKSKSYDLNMIAHLGPIAHVTST
jgi:hypothetical protein